MMLKFKSQETIEEEYAKYGEDYLGGIGKDTILFMVRNYPIVHVREIRNCRPHKWYLIDERAYSWPEWLFAEVTDDDT